MKLHEHWNRLTDSNSIPPNQGYNIFAIIATKCRLSYFQSTSKYVTTFSSLCHFYSSFFSYSTRHRFFSSIAGAFSRFVHKLSAVSKATNDKTLQFGQ